MSTVSIGFVQCHLVLSNVNKRPADVCTYDLIAG